MNSKPQASPVRVALVGAIVAVLSVSVGCGTNTDREQSNAGSPRAAAACSVDEQQILQVTPGRSTYETNSGVVSLVDGSLTWTVQGAAVSRTLVERDVDYVFGLFETSSGGVVVYRTEEADEDSELRAVEVAGDTAPVMLGYASAPEFAVISVTLQQPSGLWVITAISDLTEIITVVDRTGQPVGEVFEPFEYNDGETMLTATSDGRGGFITVTESYENEPSSAESSEPNRWTAIRLNQAGVEIGRYNLSEATTAIIEGATPVPLPDGSIVLRTPTEDLVIRPHGMTSLQVTSRC